MARIVRHNDESVREGYIRNGGKEVKLFTRALKDFQYNNRNIMAQRKHLEGVISRLWQRFQDDGNVSRCYSTGRLGVTTPNEDRYIWQLLPKETDGAQHQTCLVSSLQLPFSLQSDSHRTLIWKAPGTRYHHENTIEQHRYGGCRRDFNGEQEDCIVDLMLYQIIEEPLVYE
ncbi:cubilin [Trichonephila clavipes]|uniref:Cubilin n=1 Tax=Trichonephila clavipes TaxID=2585209 RepID=A0A8X6RIW0_TRICX|nr:cubilin [Trichonephila clavipes]